MRVRLILAVLLLIVPLLELYVIIQVGQLIGAWPTIGLLLLESVIGAWLIKREGARAWRTLQAAIGTGQLPGRELADAALILVGGTLLLTPGFLTDIVGFFLILPPTRPIARRMLGWFVTRRLLVASNRFGPAPPPPGQRIVPGQVLDE
ncbi:MAG TPA: FxsA family protein [Actinomycetes bacterium]|nr:FxsA family protein [Actinomycetes bacterium]